MRFRLPFDDRLTLFPSFASLLERLFSSFVVLSIFCPTTASVRFSVLKNLGPPFRSSFRFVLISCPVMVDELRLPCMSLSLSLCCVVRMVGTNPQT